MERNGFTLTEIMVVIAILGILGASTVPVYQTYQQRAYGSEAHLMAKRILDGQIAYFLEHNQFFPPPDYSGSNPIEILASTPADDFKIADIYNAIKIIIPIDHRLDYYLASDHTPGNESFTIVIWAEGDFPLFKWGGRPGSVIGSIDKDGRMMLVGQ